MKMQFVAIGVVLTMLAVPVSTNAQAIGDVADDSVAGAVSGAVVGGPRGCRRRRSGRCNRRRNE